MQSLYFGTTINGVACKRMIKAIKPSIPERNGYAVNEFIRKYRLTLCDFRTVEDLLYELWENGEAQTYSAKVANVFARYGFSVEKDYSGVVYVIG